MNSFRPLQLSKETLRHLSDDSARFARGGVSPANYNTFSACFGDPCDSDNGTCTTGTMTGHPSTRNSTSAGC